MNRSFYKKELNFSTMEKELDVIDEADERIISENTSKRSIQKPNTFKIHKKSIDSRPNSDLRIVFPKNSQKPKKIILKSQKVIEDQIKKDHEQDNQTSRNLSRSTKSKSIARKARLKFASSQGFELANWKAKLSNSVDLKNNHTSDEY